MSFLNYKKKIISDDLIKTFIHNYDQDGDFALSYQEMLNFIVPRNSNQLKSLLLNRNLTYLDRKLNYYIEETLTCLLLKEVDLIEKLKIIADKIQHVKEFTIYELFASIDYNNDRYISAASIRQFMKSSGYVIDEREADELIFRLDKDKDGKISYEEFQEIFARESKKLINGNLNVTQDFNKNNSKEKLFHFTRTERYEGLPNEVSGYGIVDMNCEEINSLSMKSARGVLDKSGDFGYGDDNKKKYEECFIAYKDKHKDHDEDIKIDEECVKEKKEEIKGNNVEIKNINRQDYEDYNKFQSVNEQFDDIQFSNKNTKEINSRLSFENSEEIRAKNYKMKDINKTEKIVKLSSEDVVQEEDYFNNNKNTMDEKFKTSRPEINKSIINNKNEERYKFSFKYDKENTQDETIETKKCNSNQEEKKNSNSTNITGVYNSIQVKGTKINPNQNEKEFSENPQYSKNAQIPQYSKNAENTKYSKNAENLEYPKNPEYPKNAQNPQYSKNAENDYNETPLNEFKTPRTINDNNPIITHSNYDHISNSSFDNSKGLISCEVHKSADLKLKKKTDVNKHPTSRHDPKINFYSTTSSINSGSNYNTNMNLRSTMNTNTTPEKNLKTGLSSISSLFSATAKQKREDFVSNLSQRFFSPHKKVTSSYNTNKSMIKKNKHIISKSPSRAYNIQDNFTNLNLKGIRNMKTYFPNFDQDKEKSKKLAIFLNELITLDSKCETYRESLSTKTDANMKDLFEIFDLSEKNSISFVDLQEVLKEFNIRADSSEVKLVLKRYDRDQDGKLEYGEFCDMIIPKKYEYGRLLRNRYVPCVFMGIEADTHRTLELLFRTMLQSEQEAEKLKREFASESDFSNYEKYELIKGKYKMSILKEDLYNFMGANGFILTPIELEMIFDRLDLNGDGRITFNEVRGLF